MAQNEWEFKADGCSQRDCETCAQGGATTEKETAAPSMSEGLKDAPRYRALLPSIIGLACARVGILSGAYGSYESSDDGVFTDGAMLIALAVLLLCLVYFWFRTSPLSQKNRRAIGEAVRWGGGGEPSLPRRAVPGGSGGRHSGAFALRRLYPVRLGLHVLLAALAQGLCQHNGSGYGLLGFGGK